MSSALLEAWPLLVVGVILLGYGLYWDWRGDKASQCPPHKWVRRADDTLHCTKCDQGVGNVSKTGWGPPQSGIFT